MKPLLWCSIAFAVFALSGCARRTEPPAPVLDAKPAVVVDAATHDFGGATEGDYLEHTFVISNTGRADLVLAKVQPNCPCLTANLSRTSVPPGGKADLKVRFDTIDRTGDQDRKVTLTFADATIQPMDLRVKARVQPAIALEEDEQNEEAAEDTYVGLDITRVFKVVGARAASARVSVAEVTHPNVTATVVDDPHGGGKLVRALIRAPQKGHFHAQIVLATDLDRKPRVVRNIDWSVKGNVTFEPVAMRFEADSGSARLRPEERMVVVRSRLPGFVVRSARSQSPAFPCKLAPGKEPGTYEVRVRPGDSGSSPRWVATTIDLETNDKVDPVVHVPVVVSLPGATATSRAGKPSL